MLNKEISSSFENIQKGQNLSNKLQNEVLKLNKLIEQCIHKVNNEHIRNLDEKEFNIKAIGEIKSIMSQTNTLLKLVDND